MAEPAEAPMPPESLLTVEALRNGLESLLQTESWDILTLKVVLSRLEQQLLPQHPPGTLKPYKKAIKAEVDVLMKRMLNTSGDAEPLAPEPPPAAPTPHGDDAEPAVKRQKLSADEADAAAVSITEEAATKVDGDEQEDPAAADAASGEDAPAAHEADSTPAEEKAGGGEREGAEDEIGPKEDEEDEEDEDEEEDPDAPRVAGKPTHKADGKTYYRKMIKGEAELRVGQDVYLDTDGSEPYVARLQEIFVYAFAPNEVYFNARWYYRVHDCHEYARLAGARQDYEVQFEGETLEAAPQELFFSLHFDENHADCILRACSVHLLQTEEEPSAAVWNRVADSTHEYVAWRAYDNKRVYALTALPSRRLKEAAELEVTRGPQELQSLAAPSRSRKVREVAEPAGPLQADELLAIWLPRKVLEIWEEHQQSTFRKVVVGSLIRCAQLINGVRTFYAAYVLEVKRSPRPYKVAQRMTDVALRVRTATGDRLVDLTALSNQPTTVAEVARFKVPLEPDVVRKKARSLQRAMEEDKDLFEEEELRVRQQQEERLREKREEEARSREADEREAERKELEREEVRRRAAAHKASTEAWWLSYQNTGDDKQREIHKLKSRLARFRKIAASSEAEGERENAARLAKQAEDKLETLLSSE